MKKFLLTLAVAVCTVAASAQVYVGGAVGFWRNSDANTTSFVLEPEVGYTLSDKWDIGIGIGYGHIYDDGAKINAFTVNPYARYTFAKVGPVSFFVNGGFGFSTSKPKGGDSENSWEIGLTPGLKVNVAKNLDFISEIGFLGYRDDDLNVYRGSGFGFKFSSNDLKFGLVYTF